MAQLWATFVEPVHPKYDALPETGRMALHGKIATLLHPGPGSANFDPSRGG